MRAQDQANAKANAGTLAKQLSSEISKGLQSISQNFRKGGAGARNSQPASQSPQHQTRRQARHPTPRPAQAASDKNVLRNQCSRRRSSPVVIRELLAATGALLAALLRAQSWHITLELRSSQAFDGAGKGKNRVKVNFPGNGSVAVAADPRLDSRKVAV